MRYQSTRDSNISITAAEAIAQGLTRDGGLYVPDSFPALTSDAIERLTAMDYAERAAYVIGPFLDGFTHDELLGFTRDAYSEPGFDSRNPAPLRKLTDSGYFLELWHGPTCAFKDMALQMLPRLLAASLKKTGEKREVCILVATSGDTGKAALEGFKDVPGTKIMVFYPRDGVSDVQKLQMTSQSGENVNVVAVEGNFDDAQTGVKAIFSDEALREQLSENGYFLSSANSINWGRLVPQIVYYVSAYCDMISQGAIKNGDYANFCVPTGNFGNILAGYYAKMMGLPVKKLICASNRNDVLAQFIKTGVYDRNRPFYTTVSPSMDILVSSNLERLLFELSEKDSSAVLRYMTELSETGRYEVKDAVKAAIARDFAGGTCSEEETELTIASMFDKYGYLIDTHTAVAYKVLCDYRTASGDGVPAVVVSTASPFKFCDSVLTAMGHGNAKGGAELLDALSKATGVPAPKPLANLKGSLPRFTGCVPVTGMREAVLEFLK